MGLIIIIIIIITIYDMINIHCKFSSWGMATWKSGFFSFLARQDDFPESFDDFCILLILNLVMLSGTIRSTPVQRIA